ncbi:MAG: VOC family protein [Anaerolineae bacterium]
MTDGLNGQTKIDGVMYFAEEPLKLLEWYAELFSVKVSHIEAIQFSYLDINGYIVEVHPADGKNKAGKNGQVTYWRVAEFDTFINKAMDMGASIYRGPMKIENDQQMGQLIDPSGNLIGIRG